MPCQYYSDSDLRQQAEKKVNELTKLLCGVTSYLHDYDNNRLAVMLQYLPGLRDWYNEHLEIDRRREQQEAEDKARAEKKEQLRQLKVKALSKLSSEEIEALGFEP